MRSEPGIGVWMGSAFGAAALIAAAVLAVAGTGEHGTDAALAATARFSFLLFWAAYAGGALASLFGARFENLRRHGREFGLAFAAAHLVHLGLVGWLCYIGATPATGTFLFFGAAAGWVYILAVFSFRPTHRLLDARAWWAMRTVGMNFIAYAFFVDFFRLKLVGAMHIAGYVPFTALAVLGPVLRLAAFAIRRGQSPRVRV